MSHTLLPWAHQTLEELNPAPYPNKVCTELNRFARAVWGNADAVIKRSEEGIEFLDFGPYPAIRRDLFKNFDIFEKILIREEYRTALRDLDTETYFRGAYLAGQAGIGKTSFLVYALVILLGRKCIVALHLLDGKPYYALFRPSVSFHSLEDETPLENIPFLWVLSDTNDVVRSLPSIFEGKPKQIRLIQAISPRESHSKKWGRGLYIATYVMDVWSEEEIRDLAKLQKLDVDRMAVLAERWGGNPRILLGLISHGTDDRVIKRWYRGIALKAITKSKSIVLGLAQNVLPDDFPFQLISWRPLVVDGVINRETPCSVVQTPTIYRIIGEALQARQNADRVAFFNALRQCSFTSQAAGHLFEATFHIYFSTGTQAIQCHWVLGLSGVSALKAPTTLAPSTLNAVKVLKPRYFWIAPWGFPGIDGAVVTRTEIYVFQVTISPKHKSPLQGMKKFRSHLPAKQKNIPWRIVYVGNDVDAVEAVARESANMKISFPNKKTTPAVGWAVLDPTNFTAPNDQHVLETEESDEQEWPGINWEEESDNEQSDTVGGE